MWDRARRNGASKHAWARGRDRRCRRLTSLGLIADGLGVYSQADVADLTDPLPFTDGRFNIVVCGGVLTYIDETLPVLQEFVRVTATSGRVIFTQRTDKWAERDCDAVIESLVDSGSCSADVGEPQPYLPGLAEYGDTIKVIFTELTVK